MGQLCLKSSAAQGKIVGRFPAQFFGKDVAENIGTHGLQQMVLRLEMGVKGAAPHVCLVYNLLHRNMVEFFCFQKPAEGSENAFSGFLLPSVHGLPLPYKIMKLFRI